MEGSFGYVITKNKNDAYILIIGYIILLVIGEIAF
jgi:hypothetical protein